ncbi:putative bifunctional diguanylate cyclase/phosphodiesterase [Actimicrobium sp. CCI2.3]|uniref:putative bifunctional diguanylate cyclase/phosphodiesterase n=1 Tax=Actimicrobium sp. CCI2.3 TaxID=3048616 RepID=UPI002AB33DBA|nr:EAL domain-containing protein [Actimicrobium sp. CCI2.3]MDY7574569.1 EAL domain-containing protein [Actimicrobium sp. CCI2.3]MEB0020945.1 EAL domain-containing protein [Actimicrobium sp. CCI2.3]
MIKAIDTSCVTVLSPINLSIAHIGDHFGFSVAVFDPYLHLRYINGTALRAFHLTSAHTDLHLSVLPLPRGLNDLAVVFHAVMTHGGVEVLSLLIDGKRCRAEVTALRGPQGENQGIMLVVFDGLRTMPPDQPNATELVRNNDADEAGDVASNLELQRIEFLATHDDLTGLPNRNLLGDRLKHAISQARRTKQKVAVLFIDLDNFKEINDTYGHAIGDRVLKQAAARLLRCVRDADTLSRMGGDEFIAVLENVSLQDIIRVANRIVTSMATAFSINNSKLNLSASVGIAVFPEDGNDSATLLGVADSAMYLAKQYGRNQYQFFASEKKAQALQRSQLETDLRAAVTAGHLRVAYQPKVDLASGRIVGAEALVRWSDFILGEVPPSCFLPIAESSGLMVTIGTQVFEQVLAQIARWREGGMVVPCIAINVSVHQLRDVNFVTKITAMITNAKVPANSISIDLTENALMDRIDQVLEHLLQLEKIGVHFSIDDFGTGYSSLAYLRKLPIHELKVDRSFIGGIANESNLRSVTRAAIEMGHALGVHVVAVGVETAEQLELLRDDGCDGAQGFLFYEPLAPNEFVLALEGNSGSTAATGTIAGPGDYGRSAPFIFQ